MRTTPSGAPRSCTVPGANVRVPSSRSGAATRACDRRHGRAQPDVQPLCGDAALNRRPDPAEDERQVDRIGLGREGLGRRRSRVLGGQRHAQVAAALLAGLESGAVHLGRHPDTERERADALGRPQVGPGSKHAVPAREPLPENLIPASSGLRFGSGARQDGSNGRRHREDVVPERLDHDRVEDPDRVGRAVVFEADDHSLDGSRAFRRNEVRAEARPAVAGASGGVVGRTVGGQGRDTTGGSATAARGARATARPTPIVTSRSLVTLPQRRWSIATSVAESGSSFTGAYVIPLKRAK